MKDHDLNEERMIKELRETLVVPEALPPGLAERVDANLAREARRLSTVTWTEVMVLTCVAFLLVGFAVPALLSPWVTLLTLLASLSYAVAIRWVSGLSIPQPSPEAEAHR